jgi:hypothetical protein
MRRQNGALTDGVTDYDLVHIDVAALAERHGRVRRSGGTDPLKVEFNA